jgi:serine/threonine-protein kinase
VDFLRLARSTAVACGCVVAAESGAHAQASAETKAAAEALFQQGKKAMAAGDFAAACPKFSSSQQLDPGIGTLLNLANCYEKSGRVASAWATFKEVITAAAAAGQTAREKEARARAAALEPRLPQLIIRAPSGEVAGITEVKRDGVPLVPSAWGVPLPVDPGEHLIEASGPRHKPWSQRVTLVESKATTVDVPSLEPDRPAPNVEAAAPADASTAHATSKMGEPSLVPTRPTDESAGTGQKWTAVAVGGAGLVALGIGTGIAAHAKSKYDDASCTGNVCQPSGYDDRKDAISSAKTATIVSSLGLVALAGGVVLWVTTPSGRRQSALRVRSFVGWNAGGMAVEGVW